MLLAIISFFPTEGKGAIGALDYSDGERRALAVKSRHWVCPVCGERMSEALAEEASTELSDSDRAVIEEMKQIGFSAPRSRTTSEAVRDVAEAEAEASSAGAASTAPGLPNQGGPADTPAAPTALAAGSSPTRGTPGVSTKRVATSATRQSSQAGSVVQSDWSLTVAILGVLLALAVLLYRKFTRANAGV